MTYQDPDFGTVTVTINPRARSIIMRPGVDGLRVTAFRGASVAFVKNTVGTGNVCERSAVADGGKLIVRKRVLDGVTVAVAEKERRIEF